MKKPENIQEFKKILNEMQHRERFIFPLKEGASLEIYSTRVNDGFGDKNINLTVIDQDKKHKPLNRLLKLWENPFYEKIFNLIQ
jgi:hypothetical protein